MLALQPNEDMYVSSQTVGAKPLVTNGFEVELPKEIEVTVRDLSDPSEVKAERERLSGYWFIHWSDGKLFHLRLKAGGPNIEGQPIVLRHCS